MNMRLVTRAIISTIALLAAACSSGSDIASPGATNPGDGGGGGSGGGGSGGGGSATCPTGTTNGGGLDALTICEITGEILDNLTLPKITDIVYRIKGRVDIGRDVGAAGSASGGDAASLTIAAGVRLFGAVAGDMLIINRGSTITANGTTSDPIIFTSDKDLLGQNDPSTSSRQWGGVILAGRAPIGGCQTAAAKGTVDCQSAVEGVTSATGRPALYGGATATDSSGSLQFVQIRYPGAFLTSAAAGDDLNGLTLAGVGSGTVIDHLQVHNSGDDGIEVFGGLVSMKHVVLTGSLDDSLDCDEGWVGNVQFLVLKQTLITGGPDSVVECSNRPASSNGGTLQTRPTIANFTFVGVLANTSGGAIRGIALNSTGGTSSPGSSGRFYNGVMTGSTRCLSVSAADNGASNPADLTGTPPTFNSVLFDCSGAYSAEASALINAGANNSTATPNTLVGDLFSGANEQARTAFDVATLGSFFDAADYIGAFADTENAASNWAAGWTIQLLPPAGCPAGTTQATATLNSRLRCILSDTIGAGGIPASVRLTAGNYYEIAGRVDVGVDRGALGTSGTGATLTIDPGVVLFGSASDDILIVNRGSTIFVNGTRSAPVIMTSLADITRTTPNATANREWGGFIVLGRAPIGGCQTAVAKGTADCQSAVEGVTNATGRPALYGGATAADSSGRITFLQIRYPGAFLTSAAAGDDLNGLTLGGVGSATLIDNVQVHNSGDDGIEIFGGTVNLKHVILDGALDDSLDCDEGWTGNVQFAIVRQVALTGGPDSIVECSNRPASSVGGTLQTRPAVSNFTFIGLATNSAGGNIRGIALNSTGGTSVAGSSGRFYNGVVIGSTRCLSVSAADNGASNPADLTGTPPTFNSVLFDCAGAYSAEATALIAADANNSTATVNTLALAPAPTTALANIVNGAAETGRAYVPAATINTAASTTFFTTANYVGAVENASDTWWRTWTCGLETVSC